MLIFQETTGWTATKKKIQLNYRNYRISVLNTPSRTKFRFTIQNWSIRDGLPPSTQSLICSSSWCLNVYNLSFLKFCIYTFRFESSYVVHVHSPKRCSLLAWGTAMESRKRLSTFGCICWVRVRNSNKMMCIRFSGQACDLRNCPYNSKY